MISDQLRRSGAKPKTYAQFSSSRTHAEITLSNNNLTAYNTNSTNNGNRVAFLDNIADKTSGIWSYEITVDLGNTSAAYCPTLGGFKTDLVNSNFVATYYAYVRSVYAAAPAILTGVNYTVSAVPVGGTTLILLDFTNRKVGALLNGAVVWCNSLGGTGQLYVNVGMAYTSLGTHPQVTINTGQTPFSATHKTILAGISGANEGIWTL